MVSDSACIAHAAAGEDDLETADTTDLAAFLLGFPRCPLA
jgi:hypothetical protein